MTIEPMAPGLDTVGTRIRRLLWALCTVAGITLLYTKAVHVNSTTVALTLLLGVLGVAAKWGLAEAVTASLAAIVCFNFFFLPPVTTFTIEDPQNWVALAAFLVTAVVASQLSAIAKKRAREATEGRAELERLYKLSQALMLAEPEAELGQKVAELVAGTFGIPGVLLEIGRSGQRHEVGERVEPEMVLPVVVGEETIGRLTLHGAALSATALQSVTHLVAIALERARHLEAAGRAEAARQSEELKSMLLDAVAHDFKTPLTSIKAGASALLGDAGMDMGQRELLSVIDEEADRLNAIVSEAIEVARIEAGSVQLRVRPQPVRALIERALVRLRPLLEERPLAIEIPAGLPEVAADRELVAIAVGHLLGNAVKYSPADSPIRVAARGEGDEVVIAVSDRGPGIRVEEQERIFERFRRGATGNNVPGTGMGLAIAREIMRVHEGRLWVENLSDGGACFSLALRQAKEDEAG